MAHAAEIASSARAAAGTRIAPEDRETVLGKGAGSSDDVAVTVVGDADGVTVLKGSEKSGYAWAPLATLTVDGVEADRWITNWCVADGGKSVVVVYGTRTMVNNEQLMGAGAWASIVDVATGAVTGLGRGYTMAYFNPSCGPNGRATLTAYDGAHTLVGLLDTKTGRPDVSLRIAGEVTSATPDTEGGVVAASDKGLVRYTASGKSSVLTHDGGALHSIAVGSDKTVTYVTSTATRSTVKQLHVDDHAAPRTIATGPVTSTDAAQDADGKTYILGKGISASSGVPVLDVAHGAKLSTRGALAINSSYVDLPLGATRATDSKVIVDAVATGTKKHLKFKFPNTPSTHRVGDPKPKAARIGPSITAAASVRRTSTTQAAGSSTDPVESERYCSVPRNDPTNQVMQPKPRQVEQAVNMATAGILTKTSATVQRTLGNISPQGMFPRPALVGGGHVPSQVVLGILAQESNMWQADKYTSPGSLGNPLVGDFYGNRSAGSSFWSIDFSKADCCYGVGQITDGMYMPGLQPSGAPGALPAAQQRAIALDYATNIAKVVSMISDKWNQVANSGLSVNGGSSSALESWFFAVWAYNTGFHANAGSGPWGVGWSNNPINPTYVVGRAPFLQSSPADAAHPQDWPYPEKVMGFAAWSQQLTEAVTVQTGDHPTGYDTKYVAGFNLSWWDTDEHRTSVKPPAALFCTLADDECDPNTSSHCTRSDSQCWWHTTVSWKSCPTACGHENVRFTSPTYTDKIEPDGVSLPGRCDQAGGLPASPASLIVDDVSNSTAVARPDCTKQTTQGSFTLQFTGPDANGSYGGKVDLHQQAGGFNDHFYFSHVRPGAGVLQITGKWNLGQSLTNWTRVLVHVPSYAAWNPQAAYKVALGDGTVKVRTVNQRRFANEWVSLGVFHMAGTPSVTLDNISGYNPGFNDIAWDAVAFQPLAAKPTHFIVGLGDSFSSGEGVTSNTTTGVDYTSESDHDGPDGDESATNAPKPNSSLRNGCHRSKLAWSRQAVVSGSSSTVGARADSNDSGLDYHFLACSGAVSANLVPGTGKTQSGELPQLDQGYLDENTTLVTLSMGGNDMRFADVLQLCVKSYVLDTATYYAPCNKNTLPGDTTTADISEADRLKNVLPGLLANDLAQIHAKAPNAKIVLMGYPKLFESGSTCVFIDDRDRSWLNTVSDGLTSAMSAAAATARSNGISVKFADPQPFFTGHNLCTSNSAENGMITYQTPGDSPWFNLPVPGPNYNAGLSQQSVHPNVLGATYYTQALQNALSGYYP